MLKANGARLLTNATRSFGGNGVAGIYGLGVTALRGNTVRANGALFNFAAGWHTVSGVTDRSAVPSGYRDTGAYVMARKAGGLSSHSEARPTATFSGSGAMGVNGAGAFAAVSSWVAVGQLVVSGVGSFAATASFSGNAIATLSAAGAFTATSTYSAGITAKAWATGQFTPAYTGSGTMSGKGQLVGSFPDTAGDTLTAEGVATAVWAAVATANNDTGSMGEKLNDAGSAGNPWATVIEGAYTAEDLLKLMAAALLGKATATATTYTVRDLQDAVDRITATVDADGNRTSVTLDPT